MVINGQRSLRWPEWKRRIDEERIHRKKFRVPNGAVYAKILKIMVRLAIYKAEQT